jgi:hypothetical protein
MMDAIRDGAAPLGSPVSAPFVFAAIQIARCVPVSDLRLHMLSYVGTLLILVGFVVLLCTDSTKAQGEYAIPYVIILLGISTSIVDLVLSHRHRSGLSQNRHQSAEQERG